MGWLDLAARVQTASQTVFGESVTFTPAGGSPATVTGVFEAEHAFQEVMGDTTIETARPVVAFRIASLSQTPVRGDSITVRSTNYTAIEIQPDGHGDVVVVLEKA
ncbi:MAG: hypothetical protein CL793_07820 [Chloroflexi bacterium]|nr:hypothetical protein [Chloroflexota bacterium]|tara:strand:+ start:1679 stop:1993 length:315 start_codon:yes stop_codon:yes gene_type:complete